MTVSLLKISEGCFIAEDDNKNKKNFFQKNIILQRVGIFSGIPLITISASIGTNKNESKVIYL